MQHLFGYICVVLALLALVTALYARARGRKALPAPFVRTGLLSPVDRLVGGKRVICCEGNVDVPEPLIAPCSGWPCLYYEVDVVQEWDRDVATENGVRREQGTLKVQSVKRGTTFSLDDGTGPLQVNARDGINIALQPSFARAVTTPYGDTRIGNMHIRVPLLVDGKRRGFVKVVERIVPANGTMFVVGQLQGQSATNAGARFGLLRASRRGRAHMLAETKRTSTLGVILGTTLLLTGLGLCLVDESAASAPAMSATKVRR